MDLVFRVGLAKATVGLAYTTDSYAALLHWGVGSQRQRQRLMHDKRHGTAYAHICTQIATDNTVQSEAKKEKQYETHRVVVTMGV